ncbi:pyridoxamine 5'-phosphate oxidase family protein [Sphingomonas sp. YL-JM2C]
MDKREYGITPRNRVRRRRERAHYDVETVHAILDASLLCHVSYVIDGQPYATPTSFWREGEMLFWHASSASRMLRAQAEGIEVCLTVAHVDSLVLARSAFGHSINYRSAMIFGRAELIRDPAEKRAVLDRFVDRFFPGRSALIRAPSGQELKATGVLRMRIDSAVAKIRALPVKDDEPDHELPVWAGLIPVRQIVERAEPCERLDPAIAEGTDIAEYHPGRALDDIVAATHRAWYGKD